LDVRKIKYGSGFPELFSGETVLTYRYAIHTGLARTPLNNAKQFVVGGCGRRKHAFY